VGVTLFPARPSRSFPGKVLQQIHLVQELIGRQELCLHTSSVYRSIIIDKALPVSVSTRFTEGIVDPNDTGKEMYNNMYLLHKDQLIEGLFGETSLRFRFMVFHNV